MKYIKRQISIAEPDWHQAEEIGEIMVPRVSRQAILEAAITLGIQDLARMKGGENSETLQP